MYIDIKIIQPINPINWACVVTDILLGFGPNDPGSIPGKPVALSIC